MCDIDRISHLEQTWCNTEPYVSLGVGEGTRLPCRSRPGIIINDRNASKMRSQLGGRLAHRQYGERGLAMVASSAQECHRATRRVVSNLVVSAKDGTRVTHGRLIGNGKRGSVETFTKSRSVALVAL